MLDALVPRWGYLALAIGTFVEGETVLVSASAMAHRGMLKLPWVMAVAFAGGLSGDLFWFFVGRRKGRKALESHPKAAAQAARIERWATRSGTLFMLGFRFLYGIRTVTPLVLGASGYPASRFVALNTIGAAVWAVVVSLIGFGLGAWFHRLFGRVTRLEEIAALALGCALLVGLWVRRHARRA